MINDHAPFHFSKPDSNSSCPVCSSRKHTVPLCCSIACEEAVTDAKENIHWLRVTDSELHAELHELQEKFGRNELRYRQVLIKFQKAGKKWSDFIFAEAEFGEVWWAEEIERKVSARMLKLHFRHCNLDKRWRVLKKKAKSSEQEIAKLEAILLRVE